jgi:tetratricopeptide (TPR) repeat protein
MVKQGVGWAAAAVTAIVGLAASAALASTTVLGGGLAEDCSKAARSHVAQGMGKDGRGKPRPTQDALTICSLALEEAPLSQRDLAATYVNRGVLRMALPSVPDALYDFDRALRIRPDLAEAHANRGAALIASGRYQEGIDEASRALELQTEFPEKAYYNRAIGKEKLDDLKGAYADYMMALQLKPDWEAVKSELARFTVTPVRRP